MLKQSLVKCAAIAVIFITAASCQNEDAIKEQQCVGCGTPITGNPVVGPSICIGPDLIVNSVIAYGSSAGDMPYGVAIKNIGNASAVIGTTGSVYWQAWLSTDGVNRNVAACGQSFIPQTLGINQITWTTINCTFPTTFNFNNYHYMIVDLHVAASVGECNSSNNTFVRTPLPL